MIIQHSTNGCGNTLRVALQQNSDRSGNQWATNLVYDDESETWMEYTQKHAYNDSRVGYYVTNLSKDGSYDALKDTMETSPV